MTPSTPVPRPMPELADDAHKGDAGRMLSVCGCREMPGAAALVARAALRGGVGLVTAVCLDDNLLNVIPATAPEAVLLDLSSDPGWGLTARLEAGRDDVWVAGPGLGGGGRAHAIVAELLNRRQELPLVLDADALNAIAPEPERLSERGARVVITPHPGEASRLLGREIPADDEGREEAALELARRSGAVVCLKGAGTLVCDGEQLWRNDTGNPGMATAGCGDVLTGLVGAYMAAAAPDHTPFDRAASAVWVHGRAGDLAAEAFGRRAVVASDLIDFLPRAQLDLLERAAP